MATSARNNQEILSALDRLFSKYFDEKESFGREKTSQDKFWGTYLRAMKDEDEARPKDWDGNTGSILTFTGLFAATVAAFVIESYKSLSPDSGDRTVVLLSQLLAATTNSSSITSTPTASADAFHAPLPAVLANALWFISLIVALACALLATLVQQWSRDYVKDIRYRETLDESFVSRALNHVYIRMGVDSYKMDDVVNLIVALVHLAVILFAAGLLLFLYPINAAVSACTTLTLGGFVLVYLVASVTPIKDANCPYRTPLTYLCTFGYTVCRSFLWPPLFLSWMWRNAVSARRRRPRTIDRDMSLDHFKFVWQHTSPQLIEADASSLKILLQSTLEILGSTYERNRSEFLDHLLRDVTLASKVYDVDCPQNGSPDSDTCVATLKLMCLLLRQSYTKPVMWRNHKGQYTLITISLHLLAFFSLIWNSQHAKDGAYFDLPVQYCLFHLRWSLLLLVRGRPAKSVSEVNSTNFNELYFSKDYIHSDLPWLFYEHEPPMHPEGLLLLLNSWQFNAIDAIEPRSSHGDWSTDMSTCLIPLHDAACCRDRDGDIAHVAACTILTMTAHILRATQSDRDELLKNDLDQYGRMWAHGLSFGNWDRDFKMSAEDQRCAPSPAFLDVLRNAGFNDWLKPNSNFEYMPPQETPMGKFLARELVYRWDETGPTKLITFADILRSLAQHVDMSAVHSQTHRDTASISKALPAEPDQLALVAKELTTLHSSTPDRAEAIYVGAGDIFRGRGSFDLAEVVVDSARDTHYSKPVGHETADGINAQRRTLDPRSDGSNSQPTTAACQGISIEVGDEASRQKEVSTASARQQERAEEKDGTFSDPGKTGDSGAAAKVGGRFEREGPGV